MDERRKAKSEKANKKRSEGTVSRLTGLVIPDPPKLLFEVVDEETIVYSENEKDGLVAVAPSGIPNAGRGLFNLSGREWPEMSVVCVFGKRRLTDEMHHDGLNKVARCGEVGETYVVVNHKVLPVREFLDKYEKRIQPYDGLLDAEGCVGGMPNDRVYEFPDKVYWEASEMHNNLIIVPGCLLDENDPKAPVILDQLYLITTRPVKAGREFFLAYGTSYYEEDEQK